MDRKKRKYNEKHHDSSKRRRENDSGSASTSKEHKKPNIEVYKHEINRFLDDYVNIRNSDEFWRFRAKYEALQSQKRESGTLLEVDDIANISFSEKTEALFGKLPSCDKFGRRILIEYDDFCKLMDTVLVYQDFQQKTKFAKVKKLKQAQNDLPIAQFKAEIIEKLANSRVMLVAGDTGCGKSTQIPQYVLEAGYKKIVCTQPRRIACISLAKRVAYESLNDFNNTVGYQIRFEKSKRADTRIIFMTEGLLLRQSSEKETLDSYDIIILDEIHERHLHGDFLIGIMKCLLHKKDNFKLILMSATINIELFMQYFNNENLEVVKVPGRLYPIDIIYKPIIKDPFERKRDKFNCTPYLQIIQMIDEKYQPQQKGDLLVFLNGYTEISTLADAVSQYAENKNNWIVLPLHSTLSIEEQDRVFDFPPEGVRKCIISTNIAETSVTIDGVRFVIDSGKVNRMTYFTIGGVNKLQECSISQDSAKQRAGRAGRTGPGICYRMYSEEDFASFDCFTPAEIHLVPLESLILHMISLGLSDINNFPFLEKPTAKSIEESLEKLKFASALSLKSDTSEYLELTPLGNALSNLPVDLSIGKMLILSTIFGNINAILAISALLSVQNPLTQNAQRDLNADTLRKPLESNQGDPLSLLNYYKEWLFVKQDSNYSKNNSRSSQSSKTWAKKRCLEEQRFYEVTKLLEQFRDILNDSNLLPKDKMEAMSSSERSIRHGELKQLKYLKNKLRNESKVGQKKVLKHKSYYESEQDESGQDIRDIDFRISNDFTKLQKLLQETSTRSVKDVTMLKIILTAGFYPQIAVEDEHNTSKTVLQKLYHTKTKNFVSVRPNSFSANNPEILELHNDDIEIPPLGYFSKRPLSKKHQFLIYQSLLETKKTFLVNTFRMPILQTLMFFGKTIHTNSTFTKFVFDDFILCDVPYFGQGHQLLSRANNIRKKIKLRLEQKLDFPDLYEANEREISCLIDEIVTFINTDVSYNFKRLLNADLTTLFLRNTCQNTDISNPFDADYKITQNLKYGGLNLTENIIYSSLIDEEWAQNIESTILSTPFNCNLCQNEFFIPTVLEIINHENKCKKQQNTTKKTENELNEPSKATPLQQKDIKPNARDFFCDICNLKLVLTPVEILKHKKTCLNK